MELVKPRLFIPKDSYEEFLVKGPVTVSYVATVVNGTAVDVVVLDKENFIRFANKVDSEFNEEASTLDSRQAHLLHYRLGPGLHYLVVDNSKEFGSTKPAGDVEVSLSINVLDPRGGVEALGRAVSVPTWAAVATLAVAAVALLCSTALGSALLLRRGSPAEAAVGGVPTRRWRTKPGGKKKVGVRKALQDGDGKDCSVFPPRLSATLPRDLRSPPHTACTG
eukprot:CAMPEP_0177587508 /NCGR_PEP_ID=MMETSP0419_2-20121207/5696_1 /TAXON_ID=582737 /ORGANISM="Tetraselmis sp., Strain GSL018" /LENGTH=221 /DNA_ID=CAMNT_0019077577 /DNA_START=662 /DNA_END=1323 /DNA_ORIENTATION=-